VDEREGRRNVELLQGKDRSEWGGDDVSGVNGGMERTPRRTFVYAPIDREEAVQ
jgi:hypothetical protein